MNESKIMESLKKYYETIDILHPSKENRAFIEYFIFTLSQSIIEDFGKTTAKKLANAILAVVDD